MNRAEFEHVLKAAADVVHDELVVVGSQSVLGTVDDPPSELLVSAEVDLYPRHKPERSIEIDGAIGDGSPFHQTYGYYAHGVGVETITAPAGWQGRLRKLEIPAIRRSDGTVVIWCLSVPDLLLAKLAAGREHDFEFVEGALRTRLARIDELRIGIDLMPEGVRDVVRDRLDGLETKLSRLG